MMTRLIGLGLVVGLAACGGGSTAKMDAGQLSDADFVGNWTLSTGTLATSCPGGSPSSMTLSSGAVNFEIAEVNAIDFTVSFNPPDNVTVSCATDFTLSANDEASLTTTMNACGEFTDYVFSTNSTLNPSQGRIGVDISYSNDSSEGTTCAQHFQAVFTKF